MRTAAIPTIFLLTFSGIYAAQGASPAPSATEQITALEREWSSAVIRHDEEAVSKLLADDFVGIDGRGFISDKTAEIEEADPTASHKASLVLVGEHLSEVRVRVYDETAVLTAINTARFRSEKGESTIRYRRTTVWVRRGGSWQCVSFHGSRIMESSKP